MGNLEVFGNPHLAYCCILILSSVGLTLAISQDNLQQGNDGVPPKEENYGDCASPYFGTPKIHQVPNTFVSMGPNSKYFFAGETEIRPIKQVAGFCQRLGLTPAEIRNNVELLVIDRYFRERELTNIVVSLGVNDKTKEGSFVETDRTPISFHAFTEGRPNKRLSQGHCVALQRHPEYQRLVYIDVSCDTKVTPMCMYPPDSKCYYSSPLSTASVSPGFEYLGGPFARDYYVGSRQYSRSIAARECEKQGYQLVDFGLGLSNNQMLYEMIKKWQQNKLLFPRIPFWTAAKLVNASSGGKTQFQFSTSGKNLRDLSEWPSLQWGVDEPSMSSSLDECISVTLYHDYSPSQANKFTLATTNCRIPHYPICYKDRTTVIKRNLITPGPDADIQLSKRSNARLRLKAEEDGNSTCPTTIEMGKLTLPTPTIEEITHLSEMSMAGVLKKYPPHFKLDPEKPWLSYFLDSVFELTKGASPEELIPHDFINIMHNFAILYYNSVADKWNETGTDEKSIEIIENATLLLETCRETAVPFEYEIVSGLPVQFKSVPVTPIVESVESVHKILDLVVESYWYSFLTAIGYCYPNAPPSRTDYLLTIHETVPKELFTVFEKQWTHATERPIDYGIIVGDMDLKAVIYSLKVGAVSAFINSNIAELYLPRPLYIPSRSVVDTVNIKL